LSCYHNALLLFSYRSMLSAMQIIWINYYHHLHPVSTQHQHLSILAQMPTGYLEQTHSWHTMALVQHTVMCKPKCHVSNWISSSNSIIIISGFQYTALPPFPSHHCQTSPDDRFMLPKNPIKSRHSSWSSPFNKHHFDSKLKKQHKSTGPKSKKRHRLAPIIMYITGDPISLHSK